MNKIDRYITVYRGSVTTGKELTEIGIKPKYLPNLNHRWYKNISDYSLDRISRFITRIAPKVLTSEVLDDSVYLTFRLEGNKLSNN